MPGDLVGFIAGFRHFAHCSALVAVILLSAAPAKAQDSSAAPDIAKLTGQPQINIPTEMASLSPASPAPPYDARAPLYSPNYVHPAEELKIPNSITKLLALPEDQIDIGTAALTFAHEIYPDRVDIAAYSKKLDQLAADARTLAGLKAGPDELRAAINTVLYQREGFHYNFAPGAMDNFAAYYLPAVLDTKLGTCTTMSMLYLAVAQRVGLSVYAVSAPEHNFLRITNRSVTYPNVEATSGGGTKTDAHYIEQLHISGAAVKSGTYMRTMTHRQYLGILMAINADYYVHKGEVDTPIRYYTMALELNPHLDVATIGLMMLYMRKSRFAENDAIVFPASEHFKDAKVALDEAQKYRDRVEVMGINLEEYGNDGKN
jgi:regulator of sirC expression with transglutaminase-like and TPR domain